MNRFQRRAAIALSCFVLAGSPGATANSGKGVVETIQDPQGDTFGFTSPELDVERLELSFAGPNLRIVLDFFGSVSPGDAALPDSFGGALFLDLDRDAATTSPLLAGLQFITTICNAPPVGPEFIVDFSTCGAMFEDCALFGGDTMNVIDESVPSSFGAQQVTIDIPLALLGTPSQLPAVQALVAVGVDGISSDCVPGGEAPEFLFEVEQLPVPPGQDQGDELGAATAVFGNLIAVGMPKDAGGGSVIIYELVGGSPQFVQKIDVPENFVAARFGAALALEGSTLVIGAPGTPPAGAKGNPMQAAIFERLAGDWRLKQPLTSEDPEGDDEFGAAVAIDGDMIVVGAPGDDAGGAGPQGAGAVYAYDFSSGTAVQMDKLTPDNPEAGQRFGHAVAARNGRVAVGAPGSTVGGAVAGSVSMYEAIAGNLSDLGVATAPVAGGEDAFGTAVALEGDRLAVGAPGQDGAGTDTGALYTFGLSGSTIAPQGILSAPSGGDGARLGQAVLFSGGEVLGGAPGSLSPSGGVGAVFRFQGAGQPRIVPAQAGQEGFGFSLAGFEDRLVIGAPSSDAAAGAAAIRRAEGRIFFSGFE